MASLFLSLIYMYMYTYIFGLTLRHHLRMSAARRRVRRAPATAIE